jgi:hypothetical protein
VCVEPLRANLKFLANIDGPLVYIPSKGGGDQTEHIGNFEMREVPVFDGRLEKRDSSLDAEGFRLVSQISRVDDFYDDAQINSTYHDEVKSLLADITGASRIEIFDDTRRTSSLQQQRQKMIREPADIIHNDYTARSGIKRLRDHFADRPGDAEELMQGRFAIINVWRSIAGPIQNFPLTLCDATTVDSADLVSVERRAEERIGELQVTLHNPDQRWYYFPQMRMDEALVFKTFDSATDGRTRFTIHTSIEIPGVPADAAPRESIETRCLVFF